MYWGNIRDIYIYRDNGNENGNYYSILGIYWDNGRENGNYYLGFRGLGIGLRGLGFRDIYIYVGIMEKKIETIIVCWGYIGIMVQNMEAIIVCWGYIGIMEKKMETIIVSFGDILG